MKFLKEHKYLIIVVLIFILLVLFYVIREYRANKDIYTESYLRGEKYNLNEKVYDVNEYSTINITDEQMANIYLNNYKNYMLNDINTAYVLLNNEYRVAKFPSIDLFINFVNSLNFNSLFIKKYSIIDDNIYKVYLNDGNIFVFKSNSVMEYEVYLDDTTIEIG